jgi:glycosyltransferase involved in cell wall biosynthesis
LRYSFCVTTRDDAPTLRASLDSLILQIPDDSEVLVVDAGSIDDTSSILNEYARAGLIKPWLCVPNCTRSEGWQLGFEHSAGDYAIFQFDTDDVFLPNLKRLLTLYHSDFEGEILQVRPGPTIAPRRTLQEIGGWRPDLQHGEDWELAQRAKRAGICSTIHFPIIKNKKRHPLPGGLKGIMRRVRIFWCCLLIGKPVKLSWKSRPLWWTVSLAFRISGAERL